MGDIFFFVEPYSKDQEAELKPREEASPELKRISRTASDNAISKTKSGKWRMSRATTYLQAAAAAAAPQHRRRSLTSERLLPPALEDHQGAKESGNTHLTGGGKFTHLPTHLLKSRSQGISSTLIPKDFHSGQQAAKQLEYRIPYWLLIKPSAGRDSVSIMFHSRQFTGVERSRIMSQVRSCIRQVCNRVNRMCLLTLLFESRTCDPRLIAPAVAVEDEAGEQTAVEDRPARLSFYKHEPGEFDCPCVYKIELQLFERVPVAWAMQSLASSVLHPFAVQRRKRLFVLSQSNGSIFYMRLKSMEAATDRPTIVVSVHGVDKPTEEITVQLRQHLEARVHAFAVSWLSGQLLRNPLLKLTATDQIFLGLNQVLSSFCLTKSSKSHPSPLSQNAHQEINFPLPSGVDPFIFLLFLKENLLQVTTPLCLATDSQGRWRREECMVGKRLYALLFVVLQKDGGAQSEEEDAGGSRFRQVQPKDFHFLYNHAKQETHTSSPMLKSSLSSSYNPFSDSIGCKGSAGIASLYVSLLDENLPVFDFSSNIRAVNYSIQIQVWIAGPLSSDDLMSNLKNRIQQGIYLLKSQQQWPESRK